MLRKLCCKLNTNSISLTQLSTTEEHTNDRRSRVRKGGFHQIAILNKTGKLSMARRISPCLTLEISELTKKVILSFGVQSYYRLAIDRPHCARLHSFLGHSAADSLLFVETCATPQHYQFVTSLVRVYR